MFQIWLTLLIFLLGIVFIFKKLNKKKKTFTNILLFLFRRLVIQCDNIGTYCQLDNKIHSIILKTLFIIWLTTSFILSSAFTDLLLNSFFNIKFTPIVKTLEDIQNNEKLFIWGYYPSIEIVAKENNLNINDILERIQENITFHHEKMRELLLKGKGALLLSSSQRTTLINSIYSSEIKLFVSDTKYFGDYATFMIEKIKNTQT